MRFGKYEIHSLKTTTISSFTTSHHPPQNSLIPLCITHHQPGQLLIFEDRLSCESVASQCMKTFVYYFYFLALLLRLTHIFVFNKLHSLLLLRSFQLYGYITFCTFIHLLMDTGLSSFETILCLQTFVEKYVFIYLGHILEVELLDHIVGYT